RKSNSKIVTYRVCIQYMYFVLLNHMYVVQIRRQVEPIGISSFHYKLETLFLSPKQQLGTNTKYYKCNRNRKTTENLKYSNKHTQKHNFFVFCMCLAHGHQ